MTFKVIGKALFDFLVVHRVTVLCRIQDISTFI